MTAKRQHKSWQQKLAESKDLPKTMVIPSPAEVNEVMRRVPKGRLATISEIRACLAKKHGTDIACPMTTGIFAWIAAHAAEEARTAGEKSITPYWRTLKSGGELNPKYPGGVPALKKLLAAEGHRVVKRAAGSSSSISTRSSPLSSPAQGPRRILSRATFNRHPRTDTRGPRSRLSPCLGDELGLWC